jgi:hypothetical protein
LAEVEDALGEAVLIGISQGDPAMEHRWRGLVEQGEQLGLVRFLEPARRLCECLATRRGALAWDYTQAVGAARQLALVAAYGVRGCGFDAAGALQLQV